MKLRLDADTIGQLLRFALERRGFSVADVPVELHARGGGFEAAVEVSAAAPRATPLGPMSLILEEAREEAVAHALVATRGNKTAAARLLGVDVRTIFRRCQRRP